MTSRAAPCVARKALACGEIAAARASGPAHRLGDRAVCLERSGAEASLPLQLADLHRRSKRLDARIDRLDRLLEPA